MGITRLQKLHGLTCIFSYLEPIKLSIYRQVGTYADVVISDAIVKNINGFDIDLAIEALQTDVSSLYRCLIVSIYLFFYLVLIGIYTAISTDRECSRCVHLLEYIDFNLSMLIPESS